MNPETINDLLHAVPFRPFVIHLNGGRSYTVRHPELIRVGVDSVLFFHADPPDAPFTRTEFLSLDFIERLEPLAVVSATGGNGAG